MDERPDCTDLSSTEDPHPLPADKFLETPLLGGLLPLKSYVKLRGQHLIPRTLPHRPSRAYPNTPSSLPDSLPSTPSPRSANPPRPHTSQGRSSLYQSIASTLATKWISYILRSHPASSGSTPLPVAWIFVGIFVFHSRRLKSNPNRESRPIPYT